MKYVITINRSTDPVDSKISYYATHIQYPVSKNVAVVLSEHFAKDGNDFLSKRYEAMTKLDDNEFYYHIVCGYVATTRNELYGWLEEIGVLNEVLEGCGDIFHEAHGFANDSPKSWIFEK